jgi:cyanophycinase
LWLKTLGPLMVRICLIFTAILAQQGKNFEVIGNGAVYVMDGRPITYTNLSDTKIEDVISVHGVKLDILSRGDQFDIGNRVAIHP